MDAAVLEATLDIAKSIKESRGRLESALEELQLQTKMVGKLAELHTRQHASRQELERARAQQRIAEAHLKAVREELAVKTLEYRRAQVQLERRRLKSPIDGIVTRILKDRGESVSLSEPVIVKVVQLDPLLVVFLVPADLTPQLESGKQVNVKFADTAQIVKASVEFVSPTTDPQSGLTRVRVRLPNPKEQLPCGATCYLLLAEHGSSRLVSND
jgi:RND family efflux transporter MFP subunit